MPPSPPTPVEVAPARDFGFLGRFVLRPALVRPADNAASVGWTTLWLPPGLFHWLATRSPSPKPRPQVGGNLFFSFGAFSLSPVQTASFVGNSAAPVQNVLVRVTGGNASLIDGTVSCAYPGADMYIMNPAGVVFGASVALDIKGSNRDYHGRRG